MSASSNRNRIYENLRNLGLSTTLPLQVDVISSTTGTCEQLLAMNNAQVLSSDEDEITSEEEEDFLAGFIPTAENHIREFFLVISPENVQSQTNIQTLQFYLNT